MKTPVRGALWFLLVGLFAGSVLAQLAVPVVAREQGDLYWEVEHLVMLYSILGILAIVCAQIALVAIGRLLLMVADGDIFSSPALRWVDAIIWCGVAATVFCLAVPAHLILFEGGIGGPSVALFAMVVLTLGAAFALLMLVMRGLLQSAIDNRAELSEVI